MNKEKKKPETKKVCNILRLNMGYYASDGGYGDYSIKYKVIKGRVKRKILKCKKLGEDTNMFDFIELKPTTPKAIVKVFKNPKCQNHSDNPIKKFFILKKEYSGKLIIRTFK
jgi:hypothetical protein